MSLDLGELVAHLKLDDSQYDRGVTRVNASIEELKRHLQSITTTKAQIDADSSAATAKIAALKAEISKLDAQVKIDGVPTKETHTRIEKLKAELASISDAKVNIDVDSAAATAQIMAVRAQIAALNNTEADVKVKVDRDSLALANKGVSTLMSSLLAIAPAVVPIAAAATGAVGALGAGFLAAAGPAAAFGGSVAGVVSGMKKQQQTITQLQTKLAGMKKGTDDYRATLKQLHQEQTSFNKTYGPAAAGLDRVKTAWRGFQDATRSTTVGVMGHALNVAAGILPRLAPLANAAGRAVGGLVNQFGRWSKGPEMKSLLGFFKRQGPGMITSFGHIAGNVVIGIIRLFRAFMPITKMVVGGLEHMTGSFARWAAGASKSQGFQRFLAYVRQALPQVGALIGNLVGVFGHLIAGIAPLGGPVLSALSGVAGAIRSIPVPVITALAAAIGVFAAAATVATIATNVWATATKIAAVGSKIWAAAQWLLNAALDANPIGLIVIAIAALVAGIIYAYKHSATFRAIVIGAFTAIKAVISAVIGWASGFIKSHMDLIKAVISVGVRVASVIFRTGFTIMKTVVTVVFKVIVAVVRAAIATVKGIIRGVSAVVGFFRSAFEKARSIVSSVVHFIVAVVRQSIANVKAIIRGVSAVVGFFRSAFDKARAAVVSKVGALVSFVRGIPHKILSAVGNLGNLLFNAGKSIVQGLIDGVQHMIGALVSKLHSLTSLIPKHKGPMARDLLLLRPSGQALMTGLVAGLDDGTSELIAKLRGISTQVAVSAPRVGPKVTVSTSRGVGGAAGAERVAGEQAGSRVYAPITVQDRSQDPVRTAKETARQLAHQVL